MSQSIQVGASRVKSTVALAVISMLLHGCGSSNSSDSLPMNEDIVSACTTSSSANTIISGTVTFDRVFHRANNALDYNNIIAEPVRGALVEIVCNQDSIAIASGSTDDKGDYSLSIASDSGSVFVRVKAQMKKTGTPRWDFSVVDNTQNKALYVLDGSVFDPSADASIRNLHAPSGWGGSSYSSVRAAGPFAVLDSVYEAFNKVLLTKPAAVFPALKLNWSKNNISSPGELEQGEINTSFFNGVEIYLLGAENVDTDEYDGHVIIHEFGHYLEANFSRSDSIGGSHSALSRLDIRVAFSEGFGNAFSGIATDDPYYRDSDGYAQSMGFGFNVDNNNCTIKGWYNECSVQAIIYDLYDSTPESTDTVNLGFTPLFDVLSNEHKNTNAMTSIFSFIYELKQNNLPEAPAIDTLVAEQKIDVITDVYGDSETNNDPGATNMLPVHGVITPNDSSPVNVCSTDEFQVFNGLGVNRFLRFTVPATQAVTITANKTSGTGDDPDIYLYRRGQVVGAAETSNPGSETLNLPVLFFYYTYVIEVYDFGNLLDDGVGPTCFDVTVTTL